MKSRLKKLNNIDKASDEYKLRRQRNNEAIIKSRKKMKEQSMAKQKGGLIRAETREFMRKAKF